MPLSGLASSTSAALRKDGDYAHRQHHYRNQPAASGDTHLVGQAGWAVRPWVAIDDRDCWLRAAVEDGFAGHFVHTDVITGLTQELADQAIAIL